VGKKLVEALTEDQIETMWALKVGKPRRTRIDAKGIGFKSALFKGRKGNGWHGGHGGT
jgi:hypothetical protein